MGGPLQDHRLVKLSGVDSPNLKGYKRLVKNQAGLSLSCFEQLWHHRCFQDIVFYYIGG